MEQLVASNRQGFKPGGFLDWKDRSQITDDVVYFRYVPEGTAKSAPEVFVWDLDKTYLDTRIDSLGGLFSAAVERALAKKNVPGTHALLKSLSESWQKTYNESRFPIFFITASPPQMEERILEKFSLDGLRPLGCFYKDNLQNLRPKRWWRLTKQVGFKLQALLQLRTKLRDDVKQVLWGDDSESDAVIYNLYSDVCSRRLGGQDLRNVLKSFSVTGEQVDRILMLQSEIPENDPVDRIYINLAIDTDPDYYLKFGRRTLPTSNTFHVALDLFQEGRIKLDDVYSIAQDMIYNYSFSAEELVRSYDELIRRPVLSEETVGKLTPFFIEKGLMPSSYKPSLVPLKEVRNEAGHVQGLSGVFDPWVPERIDYVHDYR
jgi:hypothetical protein